jgi:hypothetical protein
VKKTLKATLEKILLFFSKKEKLTSWRCCLEQEKNDTCMGSSGGGSFAFGKKERVLVRFLRDLVGSFLITTFESSILQQKT